MPEPHVNEKARIIIRAFQSAGRSDQWALAQIRFFTR
jgi:hypothetical protein